MNIFVIVFDCEDIEVFNVVLYKIFKMVEKFVECYIIVVEWLVGVDFV